jgi:hypothetical protein
MREASSVLNPTGVLVQGYPTCHFVTENQLEDCGRGASRFGILATIWQSAGSSNSNEWKEGGKAVAGLGDSHAL